MNTNDHILLSDYLSATRDIIQRNGTRIRELELEIEKTLHQSQSSPQIILAYQSIDLVLQVNQELLRVIQLAEDQSRLSDDLFLDISKLDLKLGDLQAIFSSVQSRETKN